MDISRRLLNLILARRYQVTDHALDSMDEDDLSLNDVISCLASGRLRRSWPRQKKYEVEGLSVDKRAVRTVARLIDEQRVRIITVYEIK